MLALIEQSDRSHFEAFIYSRFIMHKKQQYGEYETKVSHIYLISYVCFL